MPKTLRRRAKTLAKAREEHKNGADVKTHSGIKVKPTNSANTRPYIRTIPIGMEPLMIEAYKKLQEGRFRSATGIRTMQRKNSDVTKCYKAAWLKEHRDFDEDRCLLFPMFVPHRRVRVKFNCRNMTAAEAMLLLTQGLPPEGKSVAAHKCGNGHLSCVNPKHLYWADSKENAQDRVIHNPKTAPKADLSQSTIDKIQADERLSAVIAWEMGIPVSQVMDAKGITPPPY